MNLIMHLYLEYPTVRTQDTITEYSFRHGSGLEPEPDLA